MTYKSIPTTALPGQICSVSVGTFVPQFSSAPYSLASRPEAHACRGPAAGLPQPPPSPYPRCGTYQPRSSTVPTTQFLRTPNSRIKNSYFTAYSGLKNCRGFRITPQICTCIPMDYENSQKFFYSGFFSPSTVLRHISRRSTEEKLVRACIEQRLSHMSTSPTCQTCRYKKSSRSQWSKT